MDIIKQENSEQASGEIVVYQPDEITRLEVRVNEETVWLTQAQMSDLFGRDRSVITKHIRNIFTENELEEKSNVHFLHFANSDKPVKLFSLDVIISVGYRIKSQRGTRFRQWANKILKEYLIRGYAFDQRLELHAKTLAEHELLLIEHSKKIDFFVSTSLKRSFDSAALRMTRREALRAFMISGQAREERRKTHCQGSLAVAGLPDNAN